jgi:hypothetical protein
MINSVNYPNKYQQNYYSNYNPIRKQQNIKNSLLSFGSNWIPTEELNNFVKESMTRLEWTDSAYIKTYIACPDKHFEDKVIPHIQKETGISDENIIYLDISKSNGDLAQIITNKENLKTISSKKGGNLLVILNGFEKLPGRGRGFTGHYYDQTLTLEESSRKDRNMPSIASLLNNKKLFLITHISDSSGQTAYNNALFTAKDSQFKDDWIEIKS